MFSAAAGVQMIHVPFRGSGPAVAALVVNHVAMMFSGLPSVMGNIKSGVLRPLAVTSLKRIAALPDLPTAVEGGLSGFVAAQRYGLIAPAGLPPAITAKLSTALREALTSDDPDVAFGVVPSERHVVGEFADRLVRTQDGWLIAERRASLTMTT